MRLFTPQRQRSVALNFPRSLFGVDRTAFPALLKLGSASLKKVKWFTPPLSLSLFPTNSRSFIKQQSLADDIYLSIYPFIPHTTTQNNGFHLTRSNGQKTVSLRRFRSGKKRPGARSKPRPSRSGWKLYYRQHRVSSKGGYQMRSVSVSTNNSWRFSSASDPRTFYPLWVNSLPLYTDRPWFLSFWAFSLFRAFELLSLWVLEPF